MLNVEKLPNGFKISGSVDEGTNFAQLFGTPTGTCVVSCLEVTKINSIGVKNWIAFFTGLLAKGVTVKFEDFSPAFVEQTNMVANFHCGAQIVSIGMPFSCGACGSFKVTAKADAIKASKFQPPATNCPKCSKPAEFDDVPEEYFAFLMK